MNKRMRLGGSGHETRLEPGHKASTVRALRNNAVTSRVTKYYVYVDTLMVVECHGD